MATVYTEDLIGDVDGVNTVFTLSHNVVITTGIIRMRPITLYVNGELFSDDGTGEFIVSPLNTITMNVAPTVGMILSCNYLGEDEVYLFDRSEVITCVDF